MSRAVSAPPPERTIDEPTKTGAQGVLEDMIAEINTFKNSKEYETVTPTQIELHKEKDPKVRAAKAKAAIEERKRTLENLSQYLKILQKRGGIEHQIQPDILKTKLKRLLEYVIKTGAGPGKTYNTIQQCVDEILVGTSPFGTK